jgi:hypothetical protein
LVKILAGERPSKPTASVEIGFTDPVWNVMERGWAAEPECRPTLADFQAAIASELLRLREAELAQEEEALVLRAQALEFAEGDVICLRVDDIDHHTDQVSGETSQQDMSGRTYSNWVSNAKITVYSQVEDPRLEVQEEATRGQRQEPRQEDEVRRKEEEIHEREMDLQRREKELARREALYKRNAFERKYSSEPPVGTRSLPMSFRPIGPN